MQLTYAKTKVHTEGSLEKRRATIDLNPTIAHVLSRDLYQRPIESMFREILINAIDAHREVDQPRPVEIHIPTMWDETFSLRDFGPGLEHSRFMDIYLAYGESSRRDTNAVHGGLGLGTKSPLAYTSTFSVSSFHNGTVNSYIVYYDEDNMPCVDHRDSRPTFEPNGLCVTLTTANSYDYADFQSAAKKLLARIPDDKYVIVNNNVANIHPVPDKFDLFGTLRAYAGSGISIVMGYVAYELDKRAVIEYVANQNLTFDIDGTKIEASKVISKLTSKRKIEVISEIGAYPVHPSREYVNVSPRTIKKFCSDIQHGLDALFTENADLDLSKDLMQFTTVGFIRPDKAQLKIRGRLITVPSWGTSIRMPLQLNTYRELIEAIDRAEKPLVQVSSVTQDQLTAYLGSGRSVYRWPTNVQNSIFIYSKDETDLDVQELLQKTYVNLDLTQEIQNYCDVVAREKLQGPIVTNYHYARNTYKLMTEPEHNVTILHMGHLGSIKRDWGSAKHNVQSLKDLKQKVFWVPTFQGCLKDPKVREAIAYYNLYLPSIPKWRRAVIVGLPASKGTKTIENAFPNVVEIETYVNDIIKSDWYIRRQKIAGAAINIDHTNMLRLYAAYGDCNWLLRLSELNKKYNLSKVQDKILKGTTWVDKAKKLRANINVRLPGFQGVYSYDYGIAPEAEAKSWGVILADLTNNKPTGAKAKNDPFYLS